MKLCEIFEILQGVAPVALSDEFCKKFKMYDNSGIIIDCGEDINGVLLTLDLTVEAVERAKKSGYNLIVTHHPAIYGGISRFDTVNNPQASALSRCMKYEISVISMHLNFDAAPEGIDYWLMRGLGGFEENCKIAAQIDNGGYGRVYDIKPQTLESFVQQVSKAFNTSKIIVYGDKNNQVSKVASFCGAGCDDYNMSFAADNGADVFVSADMKHHEILALTQRGMAVIVLTHYASENYGLNKIYQKIKDDIKVKSEYLTFENLL